MHMYVPRDDAMDRCKKEDFDVGKKKGMRRNFVPYLAAIADKDSFKSFSDISGLYRERSSLDIKSPLAKVIGKVQESIELLKFDPPMNISSKHQLSSFLDSFFFEYGVQSCFVREIASCEILLQSTNKSFFHNFFYFEKR